jgi:two-component system, sensor histidine kinase
MTEVEKPSNGVRSRHVLIVEDNADARESLRLLLHLLGYRVEVARDGREGVQKALASHPEVGLIDIGLPGLDGYEVARRLRSTLGASIVLIAHTAYTQPEDRERAFEAGFNVFLGKPAEPNRLTDLLNRA